MQFEASMALNKKNRLLSKPVFVKYDIEN